MSDYENFKNTQGNSSGTNRKDKIMNLQQMDLENRSLVDSIKGQRWIEKQLIKKNSELIWKRRSLYIAQWHYFDKKRDALSLNKKKNAHALFELLVSKERLSASLNDLRTQLHILKDRLLGDPEGALAIVASVIDFYDFLKPSIVHKEYGEQNYIMLQQHNDVLRKRNIDLQMSIKDLYATIDTHVIKYRQAKLYNRLNCIIA